jgi:hypothetical protein
VTLMESYRATAYAESVALRAWARAGVMPRGGPVDRWAEWQRHKKCNTTTRKTAA